MLVEPNSRQAVAVAGGARRKKRLKGQRDLKMRGNSKTLRHQ